MIGTWRRFHWKMLHRGGNFCSMYVQTELGGSHQTNDPRAMPLEEYIAETMQILKSQPEASENCVERAKFLRFAEATGTFDKALQMLTEMSFD